VKENKRNSDSNFSPKNGNRQFFDYEELKEPELTPQVILESQSNHTTLRNFVAGLGLGQLAHTKPWI
jgi:hypothetical protein